MEKKESKSKLINVCLNCEKVEMFGEWTEPSFEINVNHIRHPDTFRYTYCPECMEHFEGEKIKLKQEYSLLRN